MEYTLIGDHPSIRKIRELIEMVSDTAFSVLILGETGTGKEVVARLLHRASERRAKTFVKVNCAALPLTLLESELFGYEKGAFTGAYSQKIGKFEEADGGTIFFDEICDMSLNLQAKLLRVLQDFKFYRLGGHEEIISNARIITASNKDLETLIQKGKFRVDLFHRLNVITLKVPPLRERTQDIEDLSLFFLKNFTRTYNKKIERFETDTMDYLLNYNWPGNIRELKNCIERAVVICEESSIYPEHLPDSIKSSSNKTSKNTPLYTLPEQIEFYRTNYMRELILSTLKKTDGNRTKTAQLLKISRKTLYNRMKELNIKYEFS